MQIARTLRFGRNRPLLVPSALLLGALAVAALLAYQGVRADRQQRTFTERTLRHHATVAAWEFSRRARSHAEHPVSMALRPARRLSASRPAGSLPGPEILLTAAADSGCECEAIQEVRTAFLLPLDGSGPLRSAGEAHPADLERQATERLRAGIESDDGVIVGFPVLGGRVSLVAMTVVRDARDRPAAAYGIVADPAVLEPLLRSATERMPLLPPALTGDLPNDSLLDITVRLPGGQRVFHTGWNDRTPFSARDTVRGAFNALVAEVSLRPRAAAVLADGATGSRPAILLSLFVLACALILTTLLHLRRAARLAELQTRFVTNVSHELRTPLAQIRLFAETLGMDRARSEAERRRFVAILQREATRLSELVENVLHFSRLDQRKITLAAHPVPMRPLIEEVVAAFAPLAAVRECRVTVSGSRDAVVRGDAGALRRILLNLLDNAVRYGPEGQTVTLHVERSGAFVQLVVDDGGPGIPEQSRRAIFEPFTRLDDSPTAPTGSGIGLTVVREIVNALGGRVWACAAPGGGGRFVVELPSDGRVLEDAA